LLELHDNADHGHLPQVGHHQTLHFSVFTLEGRQLLFKQTDGGRKQQCEPETEDQDGLGDFVCIDLGALAEVAPDGECRSGLESSPDHLEAAHDVQHDQVGRHDVVVVVDLLQDQLGFLQRHLVEQQHENGGHSLLE